MAETSQALACTREQTVLGEGARWDPRRNELLRVDILTGRVFRDRVATAGGLAAVHHYSLGVPVGAVAPVEGDEGWLLAAGRSFVHLGPDGRWRWVLPDIAPSETRMNDAACDSQGRCWAGTLADDHRPGGGALYRLDVDGSVTQMLDGLTIANGLGWSPDGATMYLVDSGPRVIHAFAFDEAEGSISHGRTLVTVPEPVGAPDGLTVDADGDIWVAIFGGGRVQRYSPEGELREELAVPAEQTTSCAFGGPGLHTLFVTTATEGWDDERRRADPFAGLVYRLDTDTKGRPALPFRPQGAWWEAPSPMTGN